MSDRGGGKRQATSSSTTKLCACYKVWDWNRAKRLKLRGVWRRRSTTESKKKKKIAARGKIYFYFRENKFLSLSAFGAVVASGGAVIVRACLLLECNTLLFARKTCGLLCSSISTLDEWRVRVTSHLRFSYEIVHTWWWWHLTKHECINKKKV